MIIILLISFVAVFASGSSFLSSSGRLVDDQRKGFGHITVRGWVTILLNLLVIPLSIMQYNINNRELQEKEKQADIRQTQRDIAQKAAYDSSLSEMKKKFDASSQKNISVLSETLGKYGFELDSANKRLMKIIRDSSKTKVLVPDDPILQLAPIDDFDHKGIQLLKREGSTDHYQLTFRSSDASSTGYQIIFSFVVRDSLMRYSYVGVDSTLLPRTSRVARDTYFRSGFNLEDVPKYSFLYLWARGSYQNADKSKKYSFDEVYYYNYSGETFGSIKGQTRSIVAKVVQQSEGK